MVGKNLSQACRALLAGSAIFLIRSYQMLTRGVLPPACRQMPSCSEFTLWAVQAFGFRRGLKLSLQRLGACHPL